MLSLPPDIRHITLREVGNAILMTWRRIGRRFGQPPGVVATTNNSSCMVTAESSPNGRSICNIQKKPLWVRWSRLGRRRVAGEYLCNDRSVLRLMDCEPRDGGLLSTLHDLVPLVSLTMAYTSIL